MVLGLDYLKNKLVGKGENLILGFIPNIFRYISLMWGYFQIHVLTTLANQKKWRFLVVQHVARGSNPSTSAYEEKFFTVWNNWVLLGLYRFFNGAMTLFNTTQIDKAATMAISEYYYNFSPQNTRPFTASLYILNCELVLGSRVNLLPYFKQALGEGGSGLKGSFLPDKDTKDQLMNALVLYELPRYTGVSFLDREEALELSLAVVAALNDAKVKLVSLAETPVSWATASKQLLDISAATQKVVPSVVKSAPASKGEIQWENFGFQGKDPSTDFRGSGMLGLESFRHFCLFDPAESSKLLTQSGATDPGETWYPPALISINLVSHLRDMLISGQLDRGFIANINGELLQRIGSSIFANEKKKSTDHFFEVRAELAKEFDALFFKLHDQLVLKFHLYWKHGVQEKEIKTVLETDANLKKFLEKYDKNIREGVWE